MSSTMSGHRSPKPVRVLAPDSVSSKKTTIEKNELLQSGKYLYILVTCLRFCQVIEIRKHVSVNYFFLYFCDKYFVFGDVRSLKPVIVEDMTAFREF